MSVTLSVIIPVYNGAAFIEKALTSVMQQPQVTEVLIINDGSTDETPTILAQWADKYPEIKILHHKGHANKGRSASRNLGLKSASGTYIAFLDADDFYVDNRFAEDIEILESRSEVDGVYNAIGAHYYRNSSPEERENLDLFTVQRNIPHQELFSTLLIGKEGHFSIDGLTLRKKVFDRVGYFNEDLVVAEDTELIFKMALSARLEAGILDRPVAMRGVHDSNSFNQTALYDTYVQKMYASLFIWSTNNNISKDLQEEILKRIWILAYRKSTSIIPNTMYWVSLFFRSRRALFSDLSVKYFPLVRRRKILFPFLYK